MAIGNTVNVSVPVVGTTTESFTRSNGNKFLCSAYTVNSVDYIATLDLRPAASVAANKSFGLTLRLDTSIGDDPGSITKGACTAVINVSARPGSVVTKAECAKLVRAALAAALQSNLIEDLYDGIAL